VFELTAQTENIYGQSTSLIEKSPQQGLSATDDARRKKRGAERSGSNLGEPYHLCWHARQLE